LQDIIEYVDKIYKEVAREPPCMTQFK